MEDPDPPITIVDVGCARLVKALTRSMIRRRAQSPSQTQQLWYSTD